MSSPYDALGVSQSATDDEIKKAYRKLARQHHPDKRGDPEEFKKVQEAYEILSNSEKRQNFDRWGNPDGPLGGGGGGGPGGPFPADIFAQMFGGGQRGPVRRADANHTLNISFEESFRGSTRHIKITLNKPCWSCQAKCQACQGRGQAFVQMGPMQFAQPCQACQAQGHTSKGCGDCNQKGKRFENLNLELKIPIGIQPGNVITAHGLGEQARTKDEESGDLHFHIQIKDHPEFMRQGNDLIWLTKISFEDSVNGKTVVVPHFDGPIEINTSDWGVIDPREDYIIPAKGFGQEGTTSRGRLRIQFNVIYPHKQARYKLIRESSTPSQESTPAC